MEIGQLGIAAGLLVKLREHEDGRPVVRVFVEDGAKGLNRVVGRLESLVLELRELEPQGCALLLGRGDVDQPAEELGEILVSTGLGIEPAQHRGRFGVAGLTLEDLLVERGRASRVVKLVGQHPSRLVFERDGIRPIRHELGPLQEQLHDLGVVARCAPQLGELLQRPQVTLVLGNQVPQRSLGQLTIADRTRGDPGGLSE